MTAKVLMVSTPDDDVAAVILANDDEMVDVVNAINAADAELNIKEYNIDTLGDLLDYIKRVSPNAT